MSTDISGIHHVTAIASDPQQNVDFYAGVLGLRLVKLTVNFDDPGAYHLYYGDAVGYPGTLLTFFAWPGAPKGRQGTGQVAITAFSIPPGALAYWVERLNGRGIVVEGPTPRFGAQEGEQVLALADPDGLLLDLVAHPAAQERPGWDGGPVPAEHTVSTHTASSRLVIRMGPISRRACSSHTPACSPALCCSMRKSRWSHKRPRLSWASPSS
jgi:glyoxalase family protein